MVTKKQHSCSAGCVAAWGMLVHFVPGKTKKALRRYPHLHRLWAM